MINRKDLQNIESLFMLSTLGECRSKRKAAEAIGASVDTLNKYIGQPGSGIRPAARHQFGTRLHSDTQRRKIHRKRFPDGRTLAANVCRKRQKHTKFLPGQGRNGRRHQQQPDVLRHRRLFLPLSRHPDTKHHFQDSLQLQYNNLDIGISYCEPKEKDVTVLAVKNIECKLFASPAYLKKYGYPQNIKDIIKNHRIVCKSDPVYYDKQYREILKNSENVRYISNSSGSVIDAVRNNAGICIMPLRFAEEGLICLDNFDWNSHISIYLFSRKRVKDLPRVRAVINYFKEILQRM